MLLMTISRNASPSIHLGTHDWNRHAHRRRRTAPHPFHPGSRRDDHRHVSAGCPGGGTGADLVQGGGGNDRLYGDPVAGIGPPRANARVGLGLDGKETAKGANEFAITPDGRWMVLTSAASEFLPPGEANGIMQVYLKNMATGAITLLSRTAAGGPGDGFNSLPAISDDGGKVAWVTHAADLAVQFQAAGDQHLILCDAATGALIDAAPTFDGMKSVGAVSGPVLSADGSLLAFSATVKNFVPNDTNGKTDAFVVRVDQPRTVYRASTKTDGAQVTGGDSYPRALSPDNTSLLIFEFREHAARGRRGRQERHQEPTCSRNSSECSRPLAPFPER